MDTSTLADGSGRYNRFRFSCGFWLRRGIDGTIDEVWKLMDLIMREYDSEWYLAHIETVSSSSEK